MDEMKDIRMQLGKKKAEQVMALGDLDYFAILVQSARRSSRQ